MARKKIVLLFLILFINGVSICLSQRIDQNLPVAKINYANLIVEASNYLKSNPTPVANHGSVKSVASFYDFFISKYFLRQRMVMEFSRDTDVFGIETKINMQRQSLHTVDLWLDNVPADSLLIISSKDAGFYDEEQPDQSDNSLAVVFGANKILLLLAWFDSTSGKLVSVILNGISENGAHHLKKYFSPVSEDTQPHQHL